MTIEQDATAVANRLRCLADDLDNFETREYAIGEAGGLDVIAALATRPLPPETEAFMRRMIADAEGWLGEMLEAV